MMGRKDCQSGFTLIELLIAISIFAVGLLAISGMQFTALDANSRASTLSVTTALAEGEMERLLSRDPSDPLFDADAVDQNLWDKDITGAGSYHAVYNVAINTPVSNVATLTVKVTGPVPGAPDNTHNHTVRLVGYKRTQ